jgi:hypothetical protein
MERKRRMGTQMGYSHAVRDTSDARVAGIWRRGVHVAGIRRRGGAQVVHVGRGAAHVAHVGGDTYLECIGRRNFEKRECRC